VYIRNCITLLLATGRQLTLTHLHIVFNQQQQTKKRTKCHQAKYLESWGRRPTLRPETKNESFLIFRITVSWRTTNKNHLKASSLPTESWQKKLLWTQGTQVDKKNIWISNVEILLFHTWSITKNYEKKRLENQNTKKPGIVFLHIWIVHLLIVQFCFFNFT